MPTTVTFPSALFPAPPSIEVDLPDDWEPVQAPGTVLAARRRTASASGFVTNLVVRIERREPGMQVPTALDEIRGTAERRPQGVTSEPFAAQLGGVDFVGLDLSWVDEQVGTVLQAHLFHVVPAGDPAGTPQLVQLTGSCAGPQAQEEYEVLRTVLSSARVTPWSPEEDA